MVLLLLPAAAAPAMAHGASIPVTPADLWMRWSYDPVILSLLLVVHWLYGRGLLRAWARAGRGKIISVRQAVSFVLGELCLVVALVSPVDPLGDTLLSAHMVQHILLTAIAPPLLLLGAPLIAFTWALSRAARSKIGTSVWTRHASHALRAGSRPLIAATIHAIVLWCWHAPVLFEYAIHSETIHTLEHLSFTATALLLWWSVVRIAQPGEALAAAAAMFLTFIQSGMLGGILSLAPTPLYPHYFAYPELWGMSAIEDQQLAGLIMWVPVGVVYLGAFLFAAWRAVFSRRFTVLSVSPSS